MNTSNESFVSSLPWVDKTGESLVFACSDGRFHDSRIEFLQENRKAHRPDAILWPGGPAAYLVSAQFFFAVKAQVEFLVREHELTRIIAVAHYGCLYYARRCPNESDSARMELQTRDLTTFRDQARLISSELRVELYYEEPSDGHIRYRAIL